jgi:outer membrane protein OmpA-like peptidoglycan-associated protein
MFKNKSLIVILVNIFLCTASFSIWASCQVVDKTTSQNSTEYLYQLQDIVDDCEDLSTLTPLIKELVQQAKYKQAQSYLDIAQDYVSNKTSKADVLLLEAQIYLAQDKSCKVHKLLSAQATQENYQAKQKLEFALSQYNQTHSINSKSLTCIFSTTRSLASARGLKRSNSINMAIGFKTNSAALTASGKAQVQQLANSLKLLKLKDYKVNFVGHTDVRGKATYNMVLSQKRAKAVYLQVINLQPSLTGLIHHFGKGESELKLGIQSEQAHKTNRRVEVFLSKD